MSQANLSTHILDASLGKPAGGVPITLYKIEDDGETEICSLTTNSDGRTDHGFFPEGCMQSGVYKLVFAVEDYLQTVHKDLIGEMPFWGNISIEFRIGDLNRSYHIPLLLSPYSYSTYRGS
ncbi:MULTISPECIES: hydroxyisourate hydrolase [Thiomicrorhabdus]|uniref:5-hydroxyisourate hydrolase n=1 Tax=Thiomicrorhabdus heinhorstiae TaxID=2748010 RepID=A0ABS0C078_9GAMM|nr:MULTISPECIES: hydroxyisourate hydrolase [Thiomicrorhabdus]MBF6058491.1 hydroxyisourate hydrolase [Thiomicrorhabdus heinhorstiae]